MRLSNRWAYQLIEYVEIVEEIEKSAPTMVGAAQRRTDPGVGQSRNGCKIIRAIKGCLYADPPRPINDWIFEGGPRDLRQT